MVLLPSGSFTSPLWNETLAKASAESRDDLWQRILHQIGNKTPDKPTHLAVNDGIPLTVAASETTSLTDHENILRSPVGLRTLYGDFGPNCIESASAVSDEDFARAFWVSTKQNGIYQTWAPRWTMFSRGNVKEKARLLTFKNEARKNGDDIWAVDLYAGIGYFVFSYAALGLRVLCWEMNPWSVEGLRRGAERNRWSVRVVHGECSRRPTLEAILGEKDCEDVPQIVVFLEDNRNAARRVQELRTSGSELRWLRKVRHVNLGLLPRSDDRWEDARGVLGEEGGWLHLHENVGVKEIESRRDEIEELFEDFEQRVGDGRHARVEHVEMVKTFAPDVWHCVFDVRIANGAIEAEAEAEAEVEPDR